MNQPSMSDQPPPSRGQRLAIVIEDALIVISLVFLLCKMIFGWFSGWPSTILMYAALAAMVVIAVNRFRRIKRASEPPEDSDNEKPGS